MSLTKSAAYVLAKDSIRVNSVHPGGINTDMMKAVLEAYPEMKEGLGVNSPLPPYYAEPEDVAAAILRSARHFKMKCRALFSILWVG